MSVIKNLFNTSTYGAKFFRSVIIIFLIWQVIVTFSLSVYIYYNDLALRREYLKNLSRNLRLILESRYAYYLEIRAHIPEEIKDEVFLNTVKSAEDELRSYFYGSIGVIIGPKPLLSATNEDMKIYEEINFEPFKVRYYLGFFGNSLLFWHLKLVFPLFLFTLLISFIGIFILYNLYRSFRKPIENLVAKLNRGEVPDFTGYTELDQVVIAIRDYIEREKRAGEEKIRLLKELERNQRLSAIGTMAGGYAHEFNNLLQAILINIELAKRALAEGDLERARAHLVPVESVSRRGQDLARKILFMTRMAPGDEASLREVLLELREVLRIMVPRDIELIVEVEDRPLFVPLSPETIQEIIINFVKNSVDAIDAVRGEERSFKIRIRAYQEGSYAVLEVEDNGCGMTEEIMERIFEPFFTTKKISEGTGLGLYVIHNIVTQAGGYIRVESSPGEGTIFRTYIPLTDGKSRAMEVSSVARKDSRPSKHLRRVLIVDDQQEIAEALKEVFSHHGVECIIAPDGLSAYEILKKEKFDLLLVDLYMPGLNGIDLIKKLQDHLQETFIVLMTGYVGEASESLSELLEKGLIKKILKKPFSVEEIENIIKNLKEDSN